MYLLENGLFSYEFSFFMINKKTVSKDYRINRKWPDIFTIYRADMTCAIFILRSVFWLPNRSKRYQINDFSLRSFNIVRTNRYRSFSEMKTLHKLFGPIKEIALVKLIDCVVWYSYSLWSASLMTLDSRAS